MDDDASTGHGAVTGEMNRLMTAPARDLMTTLFMIFFSYSWALFFFVCVCVCVSCEFFSCPNFNCFLCWPRSLFFLASPSCYSPGSGLSGDSASFNFPLGPTASEHSVTS